MGDVAILTDGLSKRYRLGQREPYKSLRESVAAACAAPFRRRSSPAEQADGSFIWALKDVHLEIKPGEVLGVIGPNGSGKSTLLKILSRITEPTEGRVEIRGRVGSLLEVGIGFHPELTGRENIHLNGAVLGMKRSEIARKFDAIVDFAEVERFIDTPVKRYSSGMYVRLAFAVAAHLEPEILLIDEVLAVGDASFQKKCLGKMGEISRQGRTVLFVSHNMASITNLTEMCVWLGAGRVVRHGDSQDVVRAYLSQGNPDAQRRGEVDLASPEVRRGAHKPTAHQVTFCRVQLVNREGRMTGVFLEGDPITVELTLESRVRVSMLEIVCFVKTLEGLVVFSSFSGKRPVDVRQGRYRTALVMDPNILRPGTYQLHLYLVSGIPQDLIEPAITFQIEGYAKAGDDPRHTKDGHGLVRVEYPWDEVSPVEHEPAPQRP